MSSCERQVEVNSNEEIIVGETGKLLDSLLTPFIKDLRTATDNEGGLAIGVTKASKIVFAKTFGFSNIDENSKINLETKFHIASLTKPFVAASILKLVEQNKLKLNDSLGLFLPELNSQESGFSQVTIKQILTHTSGIPGHISFDDWRNPIVGENALEKNLSELQEFELDFKPGSEFSYSNAAFDILGLVISRVSNRSFFDFVEQEILEPIGMINSEFRKPTNEIPQDWANSHAYGLHTQVLVPYPYNLKIAPSSGLKSSIIDMCNWGLFHLGNGTINQQEVIDTNLFNNMISPQIKTPWGDDIGLSWFLQEYLDRPIIMHTGDSHGFESMIYIYPEDEISIVVLSNRSFSRSGRIINATSEVLFGEQIKSYQVSGIYKYSQAYKSQGPDKANELWMSMKKDTIDNYTIDDYSILTSADILDNGGKYEESKDLLHFFLEQKPNSTFGWRLLGKANLNLGDTTTAITCYKKTLEINPNYTKGRVALEKLIGNKN